MNSGEFVWYAEVAMRQPARTGWQRRLSETLDVADRTIRRWASGETSVPDAVATTVREGVLRWVGDVPGMSASALDFDSDRAGRAADELLLLARREDAQDSLLLGQTLYVAGVGGAAALNWSTGGGDYRETSLGRRLYKLAEIAQRKKWEPEEFGVGMIDPEKRIGPPWFQAVVWPEA